MKATNIKWVLVLLFTMAIPFVVLADGPGFGDDVDDVPVDGGISLLVAAGVGYGIKKVRKKNNAQ
jgi:hypothetical protein